MRGIFSLPSQLSSYNGVLFIYIKGPVHTPQSQNALPLLHMKSAATEGGNGGKREYSRHIIDRQDTDTLIEIRMTIQIAP